MEKNKDIDLGNNNNIHFVLIFNNDAKTVPGENKKLYIGMIYIDKPKSIKYDVPHKLGVYKDNIITLLTTENNAMPCVFTGDSLVPIPIISYLRRYSDNKLKHLDYIQAKSVTDKPTSIFGVKEITDSITDYINSTHTKTLSEFLVLNDDSDFTMDSEYNKFFKKTFMGDKIKFFNFADKFLITSSSMELKKRFKGYKLINGLTIPGKGDDKVNTLNITSLNDILYKQDYFISKDPDKKDPDILKLKDVISSISSTHPLEEVPTRILTLFHAYSGLIFNSLLYGGDNADVDEIIDVIVGNIEENSNKIFPKFIEHLTKMKPTDYLSYEKLSDYFREKIEDKLNERLIKEEEYSPDDREVLLNFLKAKQIEGATKFNILRKIFESLTLPEIKLTKEEKEKAKLEAEAKAKAKLEAEAKAKAKELASSKGPGTGTPVPGTGKPGTGGTGKGKSGSSKSKGGGGYIKTQKGGGLTLNEVNKKLRITASGKKLIREIETIWNENGGQGNFFDPTTEEIQEINNQGEIREMFTNSISELQHLAGPGNQVMLDPSNNQPIVVSGDGQKTELVKYMMSIGKLEELKQLRGYTYMPGGILSMIGELSKDTQLTQTSDRMKEMLKRDKPMNDKIQDIVKELDKLLKKITAGARDSFETTLFNVDTYLYKLQKLEKMFKVPKEDEIIPKAKKETVDTVFNPDEIGKTPDTLLLDSRVTSEKISNTGMYKEIMNTKYTLLKNYSDSMNLQTTAFPSFVNNVYKPPSSIGTTGDTAHGEKEIIRDFLMTPTTKDELGKPKYINVVPKALKDTNLLIDIISNLNPMYVMNALKKLHDLYMDNRFYTSNDDFMKLIQLRGNFIQEFNSPDKDIKTSSLYNTLLREDFLYVTNSIDKKLIVKYDDYGSETKEWQEQIRADITFGT